MAGKENESLKPKKEVGDEVRWNWMSRRGHEKMFPVWGGGRTGENHATKQKKIQSLEWETVRNGHVFGRVSGLEKRSLRWNKNCQAWESEYSVILCREYSVLNFGEGRSRWELCHYCWWKPLAQYPIPLQCWQTQMQISTVIIHNTVNSIDRSPCSCYEGFSSTKVMWVSVWYCLVEYILVCCCL